MKQKEKEAEEPFGWLSGIILHHLKQETALRELIISSLSLENLDLKELKVCCAGQWDRNAKLNVSSQTPSLSNRTQNNTVNILASNIFIEDAQILSIIPYKTISFYDHDMCVILARVGNTLAL